jgi:4-hydroxybenzoate polyprenyltransferase
MKTIGAFFRLIRWPNLVFIILTQVLYYYCIFLPMQQNSHINSSILCLMLSASVCIAAAGYAINDYFDVQIDAINKPEKRVVQTYIRKRWAIFWHLFLSAFGLGASIYLGWQTKNWVIPVVNSFAVVLLWFYSTHFKRQLLIGNFVIAGLTAWTVLVMYFLFTSKGFLPDQFNNIGHVNGRRLFKFTMLFAGFAFITTIIREVVKDIEDEQGDRKYKCKTMPIVWGVPASKVFVAVWLIVMLLCLAVICTYSILSGWYIVFAYVSLLLLLPCIIMGKVLLQANSKDDYSKLSNIIKVQMLFGILGMTLLLLNH